MSMNAIALILATLAASPAGDDGNLRLNQIQVIGTHNSYHVAPHPSILALLAAGGKEKAEGLDYTHRPLAEQFSDLGIRQIELDVFADPEGGHFAEPSARKVVATLGQDPGPDPGEGGALRRPGMKVLHVQDIDFRTTVPTFVDALRQVRDWSKAHPRHVPILVLVELKDSAVPALPTTPVPFDARQIDAVEAEILSVLERSQILTPDDVRGDHATLPAALRDRGWPTLESARGKVLFALDNEGKIRDLYLQGRENLEGRLMFATVDGPEHPAAAWFKINDPIRDYDRIRDLVRRGFLVRTRADANTAQAREDDPTQRDRALASGAQFVSTDYPEPRPDFSGYRVRLPGGVVARRNPVSGGEGGPGDLESPAADAIEAAGK